MPKLTGKLTIHKVYYLSETIQDGDFATDHTNTEVYEDIHATEAAAILNRLGLSFQATGNSWAADPDGSYTVNYGTGMECQTSGHLDGFADRLVAAIMAKVG